MNFPILHPHVRPISSISILPILILLHTHTYAHTCAQAFKQITVCLITIFVNNCWVWELSANWWKSAIKLHISDRCVYMGGNQVLIVIPGLGNISGSGWLDAAHDIDMSSTNAYSDIN